MVSWVNQNKLNVLTVTTVASTLSTNVDCQRCYTVICLSVSQIIDRPPFWRRLLWINVHYITDLKLMEPAHLRSVNKCDKYLQNIDADREYKRC